jgi:hypothetical protein
MDRKITGLVLAVMVASLGGCDAVFGDDGGQSGEEGARCDAVRTVALSDDEDSELGFGADEVRALIDGPHTGTLAWDAGGETGVTLTIGELAEPRFLDQEWVDAGSGTEPAFTGDCPDVIAHDAHVTLVTDDGVFDEAFDVRIDAEAADLAYFYAELDLTALGGTFEFPGAADYDAVRAFVDATFDGTGSHGALDGQGERVDGDVASATNVPIATW